LRKRPPCFDLCILERWEVSRRLYRVTFAVRDLEIELHGRWNFCDPTSVTPKGRISKEFGC
jgi:hypothetical protein